MSGEPAQGRAAESKVALVKGTADVLPAEFARLHSLERGLLDHFALAGYRQVRVPTLEDRALHERKSGARIVASLYQVSGGWNEPVCLRPEVTTGIVRAYNDAPEPMPLPWRVSYAGPVFRRLPTGPGVLREFHQVGVERLDEPGSGGDAEAIWLADWSLAEAGIPDATIRVGHAGLIQELLKRSGLPLGVQVALVEVLGEAAGAEDAATHEDRVLNAAEAHLNSLAEWLAASHSDETAVPPEDAGVDRLFRTLYPQVVGRRSGRDIIGRIRRKWDLGHGLAGVLDQVRSRVRELADLRGPALDVLDRLWRYSDLVPALTNELTDLVADLRAYGVDPARVELDLGFGRGIGFYSQMMFVLLADTPDGPVEVCGGGRYDGLARALGSPRDVGGVGFAFGLERLHEALGTLGKGQANPPRQPILLVARGPDAYGLAAWLRSKGYEVVLTEGSGRKVDATGFARVIQAGGADLLVNDPNGATTRLASREDLLRLLNGGRS